MEYIYAENFNMCKQVYFEQIAAEERGDMAFVCADGSILSVSPTPLPIRPDEDAKRERSPYVDDGARPTPMADDDVNKALNIVYAHDFVEAARGASADGTIIIAALTKPFFLKSERDAARAALTEELEALCDGNSVIVVFDMDIFRKISDDMSEDETREIVDIARQRANK